jgi:hypothetical protein
MKTNENLYNTSDLPLATTLSLYFPIESIDTSDSKRVLFEFQQSQELNNLIDLYWRGEVTVDPQKYFNQLKVIKSRIYSRI